MRTGNATKLQNFWQIFWNSMCYFVCIYAHMNICIIYACVCIINFALSSVKFWLCHWCEDRFNLIWLSGLHWCWCKKKFKACAMKHKFTCFSKQLFTKIFVCKNESISLTSLTCHSNVFTMDSHHEGTLIILFLEEGGSCHAFGHWFLW